MPPYEIAPCTAIWLPLMLMLPLLRTFPLMSICEPDSWSPLPHTAGAVARIAYPWAATGSVVTGGCVVVVVEVVDVVDGRRWSASWSSSWSWSMWWSVAVVVVVDVVVGGSVVVVVVVRRRDLAGVGGSGCAELTPRPYVVTDVHQFAMSELSAAGSRSDALAPGTAGSGRAAVQVDAIDRHEVGVEQRDLVGRVAEREVRVEAVGRRMRRR